MPGTVPLGMMSPASFQQTTGSGSAWQTAPAPTKGSKAPAIFIGVCAVLALVGAGGLFAASKLRKGVEPTAASSSTPSSVAASAAPPETVALPAAVAPSADPAPPPSSAPAVAAPAPKHHGGPTIVAPTIVAPKIEPPKIEPPKIEPPKIEPPKVEPKPKPAVSASPQQNSR
jgi:hypothetical protein